MLHHLLIKLTMRSLSIILILFFHSSICGQSFDHTTSSITNSSQFEGQTFKILQVKKHLSSEQKEKLLSKGIQFIGYLPHYKWIISLNSNFDSSILSPLTEYSILDVPLSYKLSKALQEKNYPTHALKGQTSIQLLLTYYSSLSQTSVFSALQYQGITINTQSNLPPFTYSIEVPIDKIEAIANLPFTQYLDILERNPILEEVLSQDRYLQRANFLASEHIN